MPGGLTAAMLQALAANHLLLIGLVLGAAALLGGLVERLGVPWITGCILGGILLGPDGADVLPRPVQAALGPFLQTSLAIIAFNIGSALHGPKLRTIGRSVALLAAAQLLAPMLLVLAVLLTLGLAWPTALIAAAVAPVTAPTTTYAVIRRRKAEGAFVDRALAILAINDAAGIFLFSLLSAVAIAALGATENSGAAALLALKREGLSLLLGCALGVVYLALRRFLADGRPGGEDRARAALYALLLTAAGAAIAFGLSHLLTPLAFGAVVANAGKDAEHGEAKAAIALIEAPFYMIFFVLAGAHLPLDDMTRLAMLLAGLAYVLARVAGKWASIFLAATALKLDHPTRRYLGLCFPSQGGAAMGLVLACAASPAVLGSPGAEQVDTAVNIVLLGVLLSQLFGPMVIDYAIRRGAAPAA